MLLALPAASLRDQHDVVPAADAQVQHRGQRNLWVDCLASQQPSTKPRFGSTPSTGLTPSAGHRMGRGKGALASPLRLAHHVHADVQRVLVAERCARLRLKNQRRQLGAPGSITPGATRLSRLVGCALSLSVFSLWQSPHSACKPHPRGPACRCRPSARSRTARLAVLRGQGLLPLRRAGSPSAALGRSRAPSRPCTPAQRLHAQLQPSCRAARPRRSAGSSRSSGPVLEFL